MIGDVVSLAERQHRQFVEREARRSAQSLRSLAGLTLIELEEDQRIDGTRGEWSALTHKPPAPQAQR